MQKQHPNSRTFLRRLAQFSYRRRRLVVAGWVIASVVLLALSGTAGGTFEDRFDLPGSESQAAFELLKAGGFYTRAGFQAQLVIQAKAGVADPAVERRVTDLVGDIEAAVPEITISSPYDPDGRFRVSPDGTMAFADLPLANRSDSAYAEAVEEIRTLVERAAVPGVQFELGGDCDWWLPCWLDRILPAILAEGGAIQLTHDR